ncbi:hypothetical protein [Streptomyces phytohabitans]
MEAALTPVTPTARLGADASIRTFLRAPAPSLRRSPATLSLRCQ